MVECPSCGYDMVAGLGQCPACASQFEEPGGNPDLATLLSSLEDTEIARILQTVYQRHDRDVSIQRQNGHLFVIARHEEANSRELLLITTGAPSQAERQAFANIVQDQGFEAGCYVAIAEEWEAKDETPGEYSIIDQSAVAAAIDAAEMSDRVRNAFQSGHDGTQEVADETDREAFEAYPSLNFKLGRRYVRPVAIFIIVWAVTVYIIIGAFNLLFGFLPEPVTLVGAGGGVVLAWKAAKRGVPENVDSPVLRIDEEGISHLDDGESHFPWEDIVGVYEESMEVKNPSVPLYTHEFPYLAIELRSDGETVTDQTLATMFVTGEDENTHVVRMKDFDRSFDEVASAVRRFSDVPVSEEGRPEI